MFNTKGNKKEKGQGLVEYALILVLVAVVVLAVLLILGPIIGNVFSDVNSGLQVGGVGGGNEAVVAEPCAAEKSRYEIAAAAQATNTGNANQAIVDEYYASSAAYNTCLSAQ